MLDSAPLFLNGLINSPAVLRSLLRNIPDPLMKERRIPGKWSIHEHVCHLAKVEEMISRRMNTFLREERPVFVPYNPGKSDAIEELIEMDLPSSVDFYESTRKDLVEKLSALEEAGWLKQAEHPEYTEYTPFIMARHVLFHDHFHMYRMEELWLMRKA